MKHFLLATLTLAISTNFVHAETEHQHDAHEHGAATLRIAQQEQSVIVALQTPAFNLLGFEHVPNNEQQRQQLAMVVDQLNDSAVFKFPIAAQCELETVDVTSDLLAPHSEDDLENDEHEHDSVHNDFDVVWQYTCRTPAKVTSLDVALFSLFSALADLDVDFITDTQQGSVELSPSQTVVTFK